MIEKNLDPDIEAAYEWLCSFLPPKELERRFESVRSTIQSTVEAKDGENNFLSFEDFDSFGDRFAWYLFLVNASQHAPALANADQDSKILPIFSRLGADLDLVKQIGGMKEEVMKLFEDYKGQPDSVLFEMLVALLWVRNGYDVEFIPVSPPDKRPDFRASRGSTTWFVETKRMATTSQYTQRERMEWERIWQAVSAILKKDQLSLILELDFRTELSGFSTKFVTDELKFKLPFVMSKTELISNETWSVTATPTNLDSIHEHLSDHYVKANTRQLSDLIGGGWDRTRRFELLMDATYEKIGSGIGFNTFVDEIKWAGGAYWSCSAEKAIQAKARDIRGQLADAVSQLPNDELGVVHVGIESNNGEAVEKERYRRILKTAASFDPRGKDLRCLYNHLYESYSPPSQRWYIDETVYCFNSSNDPTTEPLTTRQTVVPSELIAKDEVHWLLDPP